MTSPNTVRQPSPSTGATTSTRWLFSRCCSTEYTLPSAPFFGSRAPYTQRLMRACTIAPAHIGHGSRVTYSVTSSSRQPPTARAAARSTLISACAAASRRRSIALPAAAITTRSRTATAPTGTSPRRPAARASDSAWAPAASSWFLGGVISYDNRIKVEFLGVPQQLLDEHGAVSPQVAEAMAVGCRTRLHSDLAVSTTGVAGPGGAAPDKPVGLVYVGLAWEGGADTVAFNWGGTRTEIQSRTAKMALNVVRLKLMETA